jgi:hypothetical protein
MPDRTTDKPFSVEASGEHDFLVQLTEGEDPVEFLIHVVPETLTQLGYQPADEALVVQATAAFLIRRQLAVDLPDFMDLDDVVAGYADYRDVLGRELSPGKAVAEPAAD